MTADFANERDSAHCGLLSIHAIMNTAAAPEASLLRAFLRLSGGYIAAALLRFLNLLSQNLGRNYIEVGRLMKKFFSSRDISKRIKGTDEKPSLGKRKSRERKNLSATHFQLDLAFSHKKRVFLQHLSNAVRTLGMVREAGLEPARA